MLIGVQLRTFLDYGGHFLADCGAAGVREWLRIQASLSLPHSLILGCRGDPVGRPKACTLCTAWNTTTRCMKSSPLLSPYFAV